ncbi:unnamed protein product [Linum trigynum]|uniref:Extensin-like n=1 Tax=Linum trigynum TaxID=586398 RepID=A0AAV2DTC9_9ROSI
MTTGRVELGNEDVSFIRRMANSLHGCIRAQGRDHCRYPPMPAPPPPPVQGDVPDPPPPYERKKSKRVRERPNEPDVTPYQAWKVPALLVVTHGCGPSSAQDPRPSSSQEHRPSIHNDPHPSSYYDPRSTYHQSPPSYHHSPYHSRPVYPPSPRQQYYESRPVYPQDPPTSSGTWHDGSSTTAPHEFTPWTRPHQPWPPTPHRMSAYVPHSTPESSPLRRHSTDERHTTSAFRNFPPQPPIVTPVGRRILS